MTREEAIAQERYEDLCEYFGESKDILKNRDDFKEWLDRVKWHIRKAEELYEKCFGGMTNREIISEFVQRDDTFAIMVDEVNGTVNIELSLDFWNTPYEKGSEE